MGGGSGGGSFGGDSFNGGGFDGGGSDGGGSGGIGFVRGTPRVAAQTAAAAAALTEVADTAAA